MKGARGEAIGFDVDGDSPLAGKFFAHSVGLVKRIESCCTGTAARYDAGNARRQTVMRNFVDVKGELGLHMLVPAFGVVDVRAIFGA